jgi:hypothetical protein
MAVKLLNIKFHENPFSGSRIGGTFGQRDMRN